ncbi:MAG: YiiX/YebB-like N1pC/P60 family cysteine hydrolase [Planctomycetota bacterium]|jgi:hypothetical protein
MKKFAKILISGLLILVGYIIISIKALYPHHRALALLFYTVGGAILLLAARDKWKELGKRRHILKKKIFAYSPHIIVALVLVLFTRAAWVLVPVEPSVLTAMSEGELRKNIQQDLNNISVLHANTDALLGMAETGNLFHKNTPPMQAEDRNRLREFWHEYRMNSFEYDLLKNKYKGFYQLDYITRPALHSDAFFIALASLTWQYASAFKLVERIDSDFFIEAVINEETEKTAANSYYKMKQRLTDPDILLQISAGAAYLQMVKKDLSVEDESISELVGQIEGIYKSIGRNPRLFFENPLEFLERTAFESWYPLQKNVALQASCIRTTGRGYFIPATAIEQYKRKLIPGDILLERRNWYMSNIGIPGFWPHVALFVGTFEDVDKSFEGLAMLEGKSPSDYLREQYPQACRALDTKDDDGFPNSVIEALRDGVIMTSVENSGHADYLAVLRPKLSSEEKFRAIVKAFSYWGRPYDYNFDFATDNELVCSELVYKSFQGSSNLNFELSMINGRMLLPPNLIAKKFGEEFDTPAQQLDLVFYLEGNEEKQQFFERGLAEFGKSWEYPKWDIMQK